MLLALGVVFVSAVAGIRVLMGLSVAPVLVAVGEGVLFGVIITWLMFLSRVVSRRKAAQQTPAASPAHSDTTPAER
jgi:hypothetical protein